MDATCPYVLKIHRIVEKESAAGRQIIIIGNAKHPEVEGIRGGTGPHAGGPSSESVQEARDFTGGYRFQILYCFPDDI